MTSHTTAWLPDPEPLAQLIQLIEQSSSANSEIRTQAFHSLEQAKRVPDINNFLVFLLVLEEHASVNVRSAAGLLLKNNVKFEHIPLESLTYVEDIVLQGLKHPEPAIRSISGTVVTTIVSQYGILSWLNLLPVLIDMLERPYTGTSEQSAAEGALNALCKICEDSADDLDQEYEGSRPANFIMSKLFSIASQHSNPKFQQEALFCLNQFAIMRCKTFYENIDQYLSLLFHLANNGHDCVRKNVCIAIVTLIDVYPGRLKHSMKDLIEFILYSSQSNDPQLALEACEFWLAIVDEDSLRPDLLNYIDKIVPILLRGMVYTDDDCLALNADVEEDASLEDEDKDIAPQHAKSRIKGKPGSGNSNASNNLENKEQSQVDAESEDDDDDDDDISSEWNYRKCCAAAYDGLSNYFPQQILEISLPYLKEALFNHDWRIRESGVLALGAIAEGCYSGISEHLHVLIPYLISLLDDSKPLLRQITCWTISRYSSWAANLTGQAREQYFVPIMQGLLKRMLDRDKRVQEAACSSFATFEEYCGILLIPYLDQILPVFRQSFDTYRRKNLLILYDTLQALADHVGEALKDHDYTNFILVPLMQKWQAMSNHDKNLFSLLECLSSVTIALGDSFAKYAPAVYTRCLEIIMSNLSESAESEHFDKDFTITSLDMISGLIQGLGPQMRDLVIHSKPCLPEVMLICMNDENEPDVKQSALALLGDMAINLFDVIHPYLSQMLPIILDEMNLEKETLFVCNNATWALGEIALRYGSEMQHWTLLAYPRLLRLLTDPKSSIAIYENAAIAIGRLGSISPDSMAPYLPEFAPAFFKHLEGIQDNEEKDSAFRGFCIMLSRNPQALPSIFQEFIHAVSLFQQPSQSLRMMFQEILIGFKPHCPEWQKYLDALSPAGRASIDSYLNDTTSSFASG